jgi:hypothetical protein
MGWTALDMGWVLAGQGMGWVWSVSVLDSSWHWLVCARAELDMSWAVYWVGWAWTDFGWACHGLGCELDGMGMG